MADIAEPQREKTRGPAVPARREAQPARPRDDLPASAARRPAAPVSARHAAALQRQVGNRAASRLLSVAKSPQASRVSGQPAQARGANQTGGAAALAVPAGTEDAQVQRLVEGRTGPEADPKFAALTSDVAAKRRRLTAHPPARREAGAAQQAAVAPPDDKLAQGKANQAEKMNAAKPGEFDKAAFVKAVNDAIAAQAPKNLDEADDFAGSGKADAVKGQVAGQVAAGKKTSAAAIEDTTKAPPDTSTAKDKPVVPLAADQAPPTPAPPDPSQAIPDKAPPSATDFSAGPKQVNDQMAEADVTEHQLATSNEPEFTGALAAKKEGEEHSAAAPDRIRAQEADTLANAKANAQSLSATALTAMATERTRGGAAVHQDKAATKSRDEGRRAEATAKLQRVFDATKADVEKILADLDKKVDEQFTQEEKAARDAFTAEHHQKMEEYKDRRYSGWTGKARWIKDKFAGLPDEANQIFVTARTGYVARMQQVISGIADTIGTTLGQAKDRIAQGRAELQAEVKKLPADLQALGRDTAKELSGQFDELTQTVDDKSTELVNTLATKYTEALKSVDEEIETEKEANKGLIDKAIDAVKGVIKTILELKNLLLGVLAKAVQAVTAIISDPIGFLGHLVDAVGAGLKNFMTNIVTHLKNGLTGWLLGAISAVGLELPAKFDLRGILGMIASLLGLTWSAIRGRIISRGVPEQAMSAVEQSVPIAQKLAAEGVPGIWEMVMAKLGDLKDKLFSKISDYLIPTVLTAGITWLISLLNPASAFVKAIKLIIDFVKFLVERGAQIIAFVNSVLDAIISIAGGGEGGVPALIEKALADSIPVLIGALASFLGIDDIAEKVKNFFQSLSKPVMKVVDWVTDKIVGLGKKIWAKLKAGATKLTGKVKEGVGKLRDRITGRSGGQSEPEREQSELVKAKVRAELAGRHLPGEQAHAALVQVYDKYHPEGLKGLRLVPPEHPDGKPVVLASASLPERIELERDPVSILKIAFDMRYSTSTTSAYLSYDNGKQFGRFTNRGGHAEIGVAKALPKLLAQITARSSSLATPPGQPVPILLEMNRLPCDLCITDRILPAFADLKARAAEQNISVSLAISGASVWKQGNIDFTSAAGIQELIAKGIEVKPLHVWDVITKRLRELNVQELEFRGHAMDVDTWLNLNAGTFGAQAFGVAELIAEANAAHGQKLTKDQVGVIAAG